MNINGADASRVDPDTSDGNKMESEKGDASESIECHLHHNVRSDAMKH